MTSVTHQKRIHWNLYASFLHLFLHLLLITSGPIKIAHVRLQDLHFSGMLTQCWFVVSYRCFGTISRSHLQGSVSLTLGDGISCTTQHVAAVMQCNYIGCHVMQSVILPYHSFKIHSPDIHYCCTNSFSEKKLWLMVMCPYW